MSIATKRGDGGQTSLAGGIRVSKSNLRVECYGTIDELKSQMGFARSICNDQELCDATKAIQKDLFKVGSAIATPPESSKPIPEITPAMLQVLDDQVKRIEAIEGVLKDWSVPGELPDGSAFDVARTICRRAERIAVRLTEAGTLNNPNILAYLNRLSDVLRPFARVACRSGCLPTFERETGSKVF
jgi:cob(I)alamin adenosyltransferase